MYSACVTNVMITQKSEEEEVPLSPAFDIAKGKYGPDDEVLFFNGKRPSILEIAQTIVHFIRNDERIYPRSKGFQGGDMLRKFLIEVLLKGKITFEMLRRYHLRYPR